jgi:phosphoglycolate phosphatase
MANMAPLASSIAWVSIIGFEPKLVLFDLDGTLLDSLPDLYLASVSMASALNIAVPSLSQVEHWVGNGAAMLVQRILANQFQPPFADPRFDSALQLFMDAYQQLGNQKSRLYDGIEALLGQLQKNGIKQGVITNKPSRFTEPLLFQFGISQYFDLVYSGDSFTEKKPHPMPLINAANEIGFSIGECLMVGDSSNDINAAKACGMPCLGVRGGYNHGLDVAEFKPDWVIDSLAMA